MEMSGAARSPGIHVIADNKHVNAFRVTVHSGATVEVPAIGGSVFVITKAGTLKATWTGSGKSETWVSKEGDGGWVEAEPGYVLENSTNATVEFLLIEVKPQQNGLSDVG